MVDGFEGFHFHELGGDQVSEIIGGLDHDHLAGFENELAFNMITELDSGHLDNLDAGQIPGLIKAIDAQDLGELDGSVLESVVAGLEVENLSLLGREKAGEIFEGVGDSFILTLPDENKEAALDALEANFFRSETRFSIDTPKDTIIEQLEVEVPPVLRDLLKDYSFIRTLIPLD